MAARTALAILLVANTLLQGAPARAQDTGRDRLLQYSLQIDVDEEARAQLAASENESSNGDILTAVSRWRALLDARPSASLVPFHGAYLSVPAAIRALLKSQPREVQQEYLRMTEPLAARALDAATSKDHQAGLSSVIERFPLTVAAEQASVALAERAFDAGEFGRCQRTVDRWLDDANDSGAAVARHPEMLVWRTLALRALGKPAEGREVWSRYENAIPANLKRIVTTAGEAGRVPDFPSNEQGPPAEVADVSELFPAEDRLWSHRLVAIPPEGDMVSLIKDFEELAHPLLMVGSPQPADHGLIVSALTRQFFDLQGAAKPLQTSSPVENAATRADALDSLRAALGESIPSRSTVAGNVLYTVEPIRGRTAQTAAMTFATSVIARSLKTGDELWSVTDFGGRANLPPGPAMVLATSAERFGLLILPIQSENQIEILALDASSSKIRWRTRLGDAGLSLFADTRRRWMPAVMDFAGDAVLCATGNGAVASVDIETGHIQWIYRGEREDWRNAGPPPMSAALNTPRFRMWTGWREPALQAFGDVVVWAGPEANALTALDRRTGVVRWTQPRGDRLAVVATDSALLTIADDDVQRLNPVDGKPIWSSPIASPAGVGFSAAGWYVLPLQSGGTVALRLATGEAVRSVAWNAEVLRKSSPPLDRLRSLSWTPKGIVAQTPGSVTLYSTVAGRAASSVDGSPQKLAAAGRLQQAVAALADADSTTASLKTRLQAIAHEADPNQFHITAAPPQQERPGAPDSRVTQRVEAFLVDRRPESSLSVLEECSLKELSAIWLQSNATPRRRIRADRLVGATLIDTRMDVNRGRPTSELPPAAQQRLDQLLLTFRSDRAQELPELYSLFKSTEWGARHLLNHHERPESGGLSLRQQARRRLALMDLAAGQGTIGASAKQIAATLIPVKRSITDWPAGEIIPAPFRRWNSFIDHRPIPVNVLGETELAGLDVAFRLNSFDERKSGMIEFSGCGEDRPWALDLPKTNRNLATSADYRSATALGPLVLTQVGSGLFGLLAFDETGRAISNLWDVPWIDAWGKVSTHSVNFLPRLSDVAPGRHPMDLDDFGRPLTQLGPITASYFCYRQFDRLVACETATGRRLWDRRHYDPDAFATASDSCVILVSPSASRVEFLDPLDGRTLFTHRLDRPADDWRTTIDSLAILRSGRNGKPAAPGENASSDLIALDLATNQVRWKRAIPTDAIDFTVGRRLVGAVDKDSMRLFDAISGEEQPRLSIAAPADLADVYAIDDPFALMIGVFSTPSVEQLRPPLMLIGSRRRPFASGTVYGLDPKTFELKWTIPLEKSIFPLDQPRDIPLLVLSDAVLNRDQHGNEIAEDRIRCFDKRTGRQVGRELTGPAVSQSFTIERSQADGWVQVRTKKGIFRFDFTPRER